MSVKAWNGVSRIKTSKASVLKKRENEKLGLFGTNLNFNSKAKNSIQIPHQCCRSFWFVDHFGSTKILFDPADSEVSFFQLQKHFENCHFCIFAFFFCWNFPNSSFFLQRLQRFFIKKESIRFKWKKNSFWTFCFTSSWMLPNDSRNLGNLTIC